MGDGYFYTDVIPEDAVVVGVIFQNQDEDKVLEYLDELVFLAETSGANIKKRFTQKLDKPNVSTYIGAGKLEEINEYVQENCIDIVIFDDEISPTQMRNIERELKVKILDRSGLILDIFAKRARTAHARTQVELAQYEYLLPRLTRMWTHLERQKGGIGMRGPGETQIETDRRIIQKKIADLRDKLAKIDKQKSTQRSNRGQLVRLSLVGYTNVGKSTLMNRLTKSDVFAENKLFATLDTTVRKLVLGNMPVLISDTVGFIRKLPHQLVESFKSTLDEVRESDILLHVVDISHPNFEDHYEVVNRTLEEIESIDKPTIVVFNKVDAYQPEPNEEEDVYNQPPSLEELKKTWMARLNEKNVVFVSAMDNLAIDELRDTIYEEAKKIFIKRYPYHNFLY